MVDVHKQSYAEEEDYTELGEETNGSGCGGGIKDEGI